MVVNKLRGVLNVAAIKAPGFGERRKSLLQDIAIVTGSQYLAKDLGLSVATAGLDSLGYARKVTIKHNTTTIIADSASKDDIAVRVAQLKQAGHRSQCFRLLGCFCFSRVIGYTSSARGALR